MEPGAARGPGGASAISRRWWPWGLLFLLTFGVPSSCSEPRRSWSTRRLTAYRRRGPTTPPGGNSRYSQMIKNQMLNKAKGPDLSTIHRGPVGGVLRKGGMFGRTPMGPGLPRMTTGLASKRLEIPDECRTGVDGVRAQASSREMDYGNPDRPKEIPSPTDHIVAYMGKYIENLPKCAITVKKCLGGKENPLVRFGKDAAANVADVRPGGWGRCAVVGSSQGLLRGAWGPAIDAHDTVIRYAAPVKKFARHCGTKTSVLLWKGGPKGVPAGGGKRRSGPAEAGPPDLAYIMSAAQAREHAPDLVMKGIPVLLSKHGNDYVLGPILAGYLMQATSGAGGKANQGQASRLPGGAEGRGVQPTTGFRRVSAIVGSGFCTRIDLYGFSSGGGKFYSKKSNPYWWHSLPAEHLTYRLLQSKGKICVYGD
mmetsp:Transcript_41847/g.133555  ORF Transcript_41847/g.133555 Transcript_41847/m.133555 type:complete len:424 (+) Transcript_41847:50-1321(+)